jgi:hypothetical protein
MDRHYAVTEDLSIDCLWEGLLPTVISGWDLEVAVSGFSGRISSLQRPESRSLRRGGLQAASVGNVCQLRTSSAATT